MEIIQPIIMVVLAIAGVIGVVFGIMGDRKRMEELKGWAHLGGWSFDPSKRAAPGYPFSLFGLGHSRWSRFNLARTIEGVTPGLDGAGVELFEYHYAETTGSGKDRQTHHYYFTCAVVDAGCQLGRVMIRDENWGDKIFQSIGFDDIDLEDPEFSRKFVVQSDDRKDAYDLLGHGLMRYLVGHGGWRIETNGRALFVYDRGRISAQECHRLERFVRGFLAQIPRILVNAERARRGEPPIVEAGEASRASRESLTRTEAGRHRPS